MVYNNAIDFSEAKVAFHIESPSKPLNEVYFPAIYLINKDCFRKSLLEGFAIETNLTEENLFRLFKSWFSGGVVNTEDIGKLYE